MIKLGDIVKAENKLSGSKYNDLKVTEIKENEIITVDVETETVMKFPLKFWKVELDEIETEENKKTIKELLIKRILKATSERLEGLKKINAPSIIIENLEKEVKEMEKGKIKIGGNKELLDLTFNSYEVKKGNGGKTYIVFDNGVKYYPQAKYGRYITK